LARAGAALSREARVWLAWMDYLHLPRPERGPDLPALRHQPPDLPPLEAALRSPAPR